MRIRPEQVAQLSLSSQEQFVRRTTLHLQSAYPNWSSIRSDQDMSRFVAQTIGIARSYGINKEKNVSKLAELRVLHDLNLPFPPLVGAYLSSGAVEDERLGALQNELSIGTHRLIPIQLETDLVELTERLAAGEK